MQQPIGGFDYAGESGRCAFGDADLGSLHMTGGDGCLYRAQGLGRRGMQRGAGTPE